MQSSLYEKFNHGLGVHSDLEAIRFSLFPSFSFVMLDESLCSYRSKSMQCAYQGPLKYFIKLAFGLAYFCLQVHIFKVLSAQHLLVIC